MDLSAGIVTTKIYKKKKKKKNDFDMINPPIPCVYISQLFRFARIPNRVVEKVGRKTIRN